MAKLIPLRRKQLEPVVQKILDRLIELFRLESWKIYYEVSLRPSDACAEVSRRGNYKEVLLTLYPKEIRKLQQAGYEEELEDVLCHELLHVWMWECFRNVDDVVTQHPQFWVAEETLIEDLVRIINECSTAR